MSYIFGTFCAKCYVKTKLLEKSMKTPKLNRIQSAALAILIGLTIVSAPAQAAIVNDCDIVSWKITGAVPSSAYSDAASLLPTGGISASSCAGVFAGNEGPTLNPSPNLGYLNDGLLNGQDGLLSPTKFISESQLMSLKEADKRVDPGWIKLGELGGNSGQLTYEKVSPVGSDPFFLSTVLKYTQTKTSDVGGEWLLEVDKNIVSILAGYGLDRSTFDHLAFSVKSSIGWAVYDFDFNAINEDYEGAFDLSKPYTLAGTWTMNYDFFNKKGKGQDISHISVWARDPIPTNEVPLPGTIFLMGVGLLALGVSHKRAKQL